MTERRRKLGSQESQETQLWTALQSQLASLSEIQSQAEASVSRVATLQSQWNELGANDSDGDESASTESEERRNFGSALEEAYARLKSQTDEEMKLADEAMESLGILLALRTPEPSQIPESNLLNKRKKRRLDNSSPAPSSDPANSAASGGAGAGSRHGSPAPPLMSLNLSRSGSRSQQNALNASAASSTSAASASLHDGAHPLSASFGAAAGTPRSAVSTPGIGPSGRLLTKKERRDILQAQLPLREGRPVAFKPPARSASGKGGPGGSRNDAASQDPGGTDWIMAKVLRCIGNDKNKYEVLDIDDAEGGHQNPSARYTTTLKAILVLPDPRDKSTYPPSPYPLQSDVIALYPETTSFYRATVVGLPGNGKSPKYKLRFEEDNDEVRNVSVDHVVDLP